MARGKKSQAKRAEITGQSDPRAELSGEKLLAAATPVLKQLADDLLARAKASPTVTAALQARHGAEQAARRTADPFLVWQVNFVDQVAAAWLLSCVFVRTLEDRGLIGQARLAGPGALDSQRLFFEMAPSLTERDYLLTVFRELSRFPAAKDLFDTRHNPVWLLTPSAEAAKALLQLFRLPNADAPAFRFGQADTRFLGDLYQDLNEAVQKRFALLQTPRFVESFILDRTLERAVETFGLDETTLIDPTCGSGHFLLGAFERLFDHRLRAEPGLGPREAARKALDAVHGSDINPYAVAIARFRLTLAYLERAGFARLADAPALPLHLVVADSLLHNAQVEQKSFLEMEGQSAGVWGGAELALEDEAAAREVLHRRYAAVVGNPPYITVKDAVLRDRYRELYPSCHREYSVAVPFTERFFQLARPSGRVGMITANSFMKREFGKKLIEEYLPTVNLDLIVNTAGADIPGHGTPTVLLFGANAPAQGADLLAVLAKRGEPTTPVDPEQGLVWRSIAEHWSEPEFENDYVSMARVDRRTLGKHPWSLGGGGASELKQLLEERAAGSLGAICESIGFISMTRADDIYFVPRAALRRHQIGEQHIVENVTGEVVRDWSISGSETAVFPYDDDLAPTRDDAVRRFLWPFRAMLWLRREPNGNHREIGLTWWEWSRFLRDRFRAPRKIAFAFVATHNHFVVDSGGRVFNRSAPVINLPASATEDDHLALLAYLNSSTACFWMKQISQPKSSIRDVGDTRDKPEKTSYEFTGTGLAPLPLPRWDGEMRRAAVLLARRASELAAERAEISPGKLVAQLASGQADAEGCRAFETRREALLRECVAVQEDLDWLVYRAFGLVDRWQHSGDFSARPDERPFCAAEAPTNDLWAQRFSALGSAELRLLESAMYKRPWSGRQGVFGHSSVSFAETLGDSAQEWLLGRLETVSAAGTTCMALSELVRGATDERWQRLVATLGRGSELNEIRVAVEADAVPCANATRFTEAGMSKHSLWVSAWSAQRREDAGESVDEIPVPPKYDAKDFRDANYFRLRGKFDVPTERFISYPGCESDQDGEPVYGWAGWNHLQRAQALSALYHKRKTEEAWSKDRLTPMLAGLLELLPWIKQWHNGPSEDFDVPAGDFFEGYLDAECRGLGLTHDDLRAWRPTSKKAAAAKAKQAAKSEQEQDAAAPPKKTRKSKAKTEEAADDR